jgi:phosphoglycerate kinase
MKFKSFADWKINLQGRRVLLRVDFNVPLKDGKVIEDRRLKSSLSTIRELKDRGAKVVIAAHLGRPRGRKTAALSLRPVARHLAKLLSLPVAFVPETVGERVERAVEKMKSGSVLMIENLRFNSGEEKNDPRFARALGAFADYYVNDAFASSHRDAASITGVPRYLPSAAGALLLEEVKVLSSLLEKAKKPFFVLIGGAKIETKIGVIKNLAKRANAVALGGSLVAPFLKAKGFPIGRSPALPKDVTLAKRLLRDKKILLPIDVVVAKNPKAKALVRDVSAIGRDEIIYDIGPETIRLYSGLIKKAATIVWNGPLGYFEIPKFSHGTKAIALIFAARSRGKAYGVCGGGETVQAVEERKVADWIDFVSTGGGAMLEFLEGKKLPGLKALGEKR